MNDLAPPPPDDGARDTAPPLDPDEAHYGPQQAMDRQTLEAERALLGSVLAGFRNVVSLMMTVEPADFLEPKHELIWRTITKVANAGDVVDPIRVNAQLGADVKKLPGGAVYLSNLMAEAPIAAQATYYAELVNAQARRRRLQSVGMRILSLANDPAYVDIDHLVEVVRADVDVATQSRSGGVLRSVADAWPEVLRIAEEGHENGISTPWPSVDRFIRGLQPGRLIVIGARPGVGKSVMGANLAHFAARNAHVPVFFASMEMSYIELTQRIVAHHASVNLSDLDSGRVSEASWQKLSEHHDAISALPIKFDDRGSQTVSSIRSHVRNMAQSDAGLGLVVVDYLQQMEVRDASRSRAEQVAEFSRGLKVLARDFNVPVVAMAQVNREGGKRTSGRPTMADLRESGGIEADADVVILLHREKDEDGVASNEVDVLIEKNRSGPTAVTKLDFWGHYSRLIEPNSWTAHINEPPA